MRRYFLAGLPFLLAAACSSQAPSGQDAPRAHGEGEGETGEGEGEGEDISDAGPGEDAGFIVTDAGVEVPASCSSTDALAVYERRVEPFVSGELPNTCAQCHFEGVSLANYVQDTPCGTMACLIADGEVLLGDPAQSPLLARILNAQPDSSLVTQEVIQAEHDGFLEWIEWNAICFDGICGVIEDPCNTGTGSAPPPDVLTPLGGCDEATLVASFEQRVFSWRGRCNSCHAAYGANVDDGPAAPDWIDGVQESPPEPDDALNTMYNVIGRGLIDRDNPTNSLLLTKPLNVVTHGGGKKFESTGEQTYQDYLAWVREYAACASPSAPDGGVEDAGQAASDAGPQAPVVSIFHPSDGETRTANVDIPWRGEAVDPQEGTLGGASLVWTSNLLAQPFGTGPGFFNAPLPAGVHTITLTATDGDGNVGTASIVVNVQ